MTAPALLALGAGSVVYALTASASLLGWTGPGPDPWAPPCPGLSPAEAAALLALVPPGATVRLEAVEEAGAQAFAHASLALFGSEGRLVEDGMVFTVRGIAGSGCLHFEDDRHHGLLVMRWPTPGELGEPSG